MKKLLTTAAVALFALVGLGVTQTHASDISDKYDNDPQALKGTLTSIRCDFGKVTNDYIGFSDGKDYTQDLIFGIGTYEVELPHTTLKGHHLYELVMQKTQGGNQPNFRFCLKNASINYWEDIDFMDLTDNDVHTETFIARDFDIAAGSATHIQGKFGSHVSGSETIVCYIREHKVA